MIVEAFAVRAHRRYAARPEIVFRAFTDPEIIARWFSPDVEIRNEVLAYDLRVGGGYRFGYRFPGGGLSVVRGEFREITPPSLLVFTWTWEAPDPHAGIETLVTVELSEASSGTEVFITHEQFPDVATQERHDAGWRATLQRLEDLLS